MSSTGPIPQPGAEFFASSMDVLRQQQQEMIQKLSLAQQQVAKQMAIQQQEAAKQLAAQQQAAQQQAAALQQAAQQLAAGQVSAGLVLAGQPGAMKTPPLPGMTTEALQARLNEQLTKTTTTMQRQQQALTEALASGDISAAVLAVTIAGAEAVEEQLRAEIQQLKAQRDTLSQYHQQQLLQLQQMQQRLDQMASLTSTMVKQQQDMRNSIIEKMG
jgi:hypothetical protein